MKIERQDFNQILANYQTLRQRFGINFRPIVRQLVLIFDGLIRSDDRNQCLSLESIEALIYSLISNEYKSEFRSFVPKFNWNSFTENYSKKDKSLVNLCEDNQMSYAIASQHILQYYHNWDKSLVKTLTADTTLIDNGRLAFDVMMCNINDIIFGNHCNHITNNIGLMFELEISGLLTTHQISYLSEDQLRADSFDVTPDFKLNLPIVLRISKNKDKQQIYFTKSTDYFDHKSDKNEPQFERIVITWIECKALFASIGTHSQYYRNQYSSYVNRFGNGLVLYKYGFVSDLPQELQRNIIIADEFPQLFKYETLNELPVHQKH